MENETYGFRWFLIILSLVVLVICIFNAIHYNKVLGDHVDDDDDLGVGRGTLIWFLWLNIILAAIAGFVMLYSLLKLLFGQQFNIKKLIPKYFSEKANSYFKIAENEGASPIEATKVAAILTTKEAIKQGKSLSEAEKIGIKAGVNAAEEAGYPKGDAKIVAQEAARSVTKKEIVKITSPKRNAKKVIKDMDE
jgi:hypothetical protein